MQKSKFWLSSLILFAIVFAFVVLPSQTKTVNASSPVTTTWGSMYAQSSNEQASESYVCSSITSIFYSFNWIVMNCYGSDTTASYVYQNNAIVNENSNYNYLATFHVGNWVYSFVQGGYNEIVGWYYYYPYGYYPIYQWVPLGITEHSNYYDWDNSGPTITDSMLDFCPKGHFTFIYTCSNGGLYWNNQNGQIITGDPNAGNQNDPTNPTLSDSNQLYGYYDDVNDTGVVGMPYAWLGGQYLSTNGYANSDNSGYCYIGFEGRDPDLSQYWNLPQNGGSGSHMSDFVLNFYTSLAFGCSINQALDQATYFMGTPSETTFGQSFLYNGYINQDPMTGQWNALGQMRVFGDGNMVLP